MLVDARVPTDPGVEGHRRHLTFFCRAFCTGGQTPARVMYGSARVALSMATVNWEP